MKGDIGITAGHKEHEAPHTYTHDRETQNHEKVVSTHDHNSEHHTLIHTLSHKDWSDHKSAAKATAIAEAAHLPKTEITNVHQSAEQHQRQSLQHYLVDGSKDAAHRLTAAHKLLLGHTSDVFEKDKQGKPVHLHIDETQKGKYVHVVVSQVDGKTSRPYLQGTIDADGKIVETASPSSPAAIIKARSTQEHTPRLVAGAENHKQIHSIAPHHREEHHIETRHQEGHSGAHHSRRRRDQETHETAGINYNTSDNLQPNQSGNQPASDSTQALADTPKQTFAASSFVPPGDIAGLFQQAQAQTGAVTDKMVKLPDGSVYMRTHLRVDADGGSDWNIDRFGQAGTSLRDSSGHALDAKQVNYFVLPMGEQWKRLGIKLGDIAWVRNAANGKIVPAIFGDEGPHNKIGEGSQGLCRALGLSDNPFHGGTDRKNIEFLIIPHSGTGKGDIARHPAEMAARLGGQTTPSYTA
jgi:hypothetical protein